MDGNHSLGYNKVLDETKKKVSNFLTYVDVTIILYFFVENPLGCQQSIDRQAYIKYPRKVQAICIDTG